MKSIKQVVALLMLLTLAGMSMTAQAQRRPYRITDQQVDQLIRRIETRADSFRASLDASLDRSRIDGTRTEDDINAYVRAFENATDNLRSRFNARRSVAADVQEVLTRAAAIDSFLTRNRVGRRAQNDWALLRTDLDTLANTYNVNWNWNAGGYPPVGSTPGYGTGNRQVAPIIRRLETNADRFRASLTQALDESRFNGTAREDRINDFVRDFEAATDQLRDRFRSNSIAAADVQNVLDRALPIDRFLRRQRLTPRVQTDWATLRSDLDALAGSYNVASNWNDRAIPPAGGYGTGGGYGGGYGASADARLTGTFRLDPSRSDNARDIAQRATNNLPYNERQRINDALLARLESPEMLAIERRGSNVTISSSRVPQTTFQADGRERTEQLPNGTVARITASIVGDQLTFSSQGNRDNDFTATFDPIDGGRSLRVTRRIYSSRLTQPVILQSLYTRTADVAQWNSVYGGAESSSYPSSTQSSGEFVVRDGEVLVATLDNNLSSRTASEGDRFTMTVRSPSQYDGAIIEGRVGQISRGGRITGRSGMNLSFDTIRLRDGRSYRFAGILDSVRSSTGETVRVDNEGAVQENDRTKTTVQRAAIGTAVGAIIGAIAGGGKGAAIGAIVGAGAGAGSVYVQGQDDLDLTSGTEVTLRASAPR